MKQIILIFTAILFSTSFYAQQSLAGQWQTGDDNTVIETYQKDGAWYGKIISSDNPKAKMGTDILRGFQKKDDAWKGQLYAAKKDKLLEAVIHPSEEKLEIEVSAGFFNKTLEWNKNN